MGKTKINYYTLIFNNYILVNITNKEFIIKHRRLNNQLIVNKQLNKIYL